MASFALVLFDIDGCTAIVSSKKLGDPNELKKGQHVNIRLGQEQMKVEILELSDSKTFLNKFEDEWTNTHRSIALDKEKKRRKNKPHGYLQVWPTDMEDATQSSDGEPDTEISETSRNKPSSSESTSNEGQRNRAENKMLKKQQDTTKSTKTTSDAKEKTGSNGRKITVLHEGSGDSSTNICNPKRAPGFLEGLSGDQIDLIQSQIEDFRQGKRSVAIQTDQVIVLGPNDPIPEKKVEDMLKKILHTQTKELLPILKEISGTQLSSALGTLKTICDTVTTRDFQNLLLSGISQEKPLPVLRLRESSSSLPDVDLLDCLDTSNRTELSTPPAASTSSPTSLSTPPAASTSISPTSLSTPPAASTSISPTSLSTPPAASTSISPTSLSTPPAASTSISPSSLITPPAASTCDPPASSNHVAASTTLTAQTSSTCVSTCVPISTTIGTPSASSASSFPLSSGPTLVTRICSSSNGIPSARTASSGNVTGPSTGEPIRSPPPFTSRRGKKSFNFECSSGPLHEISDPNDMVGIPSDAEVRIRQSVISDVLEESCSRGNLSWRLTQAVYRPEELSGRNYKGGRSKSALSPRRRHAVEHAVIENYGMTKETFVDIHQSVNTGLRNMKMRNRLPLIIITPNNNNSQQQ